MVGLTPPELDSRARLWQSRLVGLHVRKHSTLMCCCSSFFGGTRCCSSVLPIETRPSRAFRAPREVPQSWEKSRYACPSARRAEARRALGPQCGAPVGVGVHNGRLSWSRLVALLCEGRAGRRGRSEKCHGRRRDEGGGRPGGKADRGAGGREEGAAGSEKPPCNGRLEAPKWREVTSLEAVPERTSVFLGSVFGPLHPSRCRVSRTPDPSLDSDSARHMLQKSGLDSKFGPRQFDFAGRGGEPLPCLN
jgi:hypothetical protein